MTSAQIRDLIRVVEARKTRDLARLDGLMVQVRACEAEIEAAMRMHAHDAAEEALDDVPFAFHGLRITLADQRIAQAERLRAALEPDIAAARAQAVESVGRHSALERILEDVERDRKRTRIARTERDAPAPLAPPQEHDEDA